MKGRYKKNLNIKDQEGQDEIKKKRNQGRNEDQKDKMKEESKEEGKTKEAVVACSPADTKRKMEMP